MISSPMPWRLLAFSLASLIVTVSLFWTELGVNSEALATSSVTHKSTDLPRAEKALFPKSLTESRQANALPALLGQPAVDYLRQNSSLDRVTNSFDARRSDLDWQIDDAQHGTSSVRRAGNSYQQVHVHPGTGAISISPANRSSGNSWHVSITLRGIGYGNRIMTVDSGPMLAKGNRLELQKSIRGHLDAGVVEWYINRAHGLEQGFTLEARPGSKLANEPLRVVMDLTGNLSASIEADGQALILAQPDGRQVMRYDHLVAFDALGRNLAARMELNEGQVSLLVDDSGAIYPLTIDPIFDEVKKLTASNGSAADLFGTSVAISGDTVVVGAHFTDSQAGSAYVYQRNQGGADNWGEVKELLASDRMDGDNFGTSVAISNDTIVVGANSSNSTNGAAYVFVRNSGGSNNWGEVKKLTPSGGTGPYRFGTSVGINGDAIIVGAYLDTSSKGSAFIFERDLGGLNQWGLEKRVTALDGAAGDEFGIAVAINRDSVVVGADLDEGTNGSAYIFGRNTGGAGNWGQVKKLLASDGESGDNFGTAVEINLDTVVVASSLDEGTKGAVYIFDRHSGGSNNWGEVKKQTASDGVSGDTFGNSVRISGDILVVGAGGDDSARGSAYIFGRNQGGANQWGEIERLTASDRAADDEFGYAVGIDGGSVVSGAYLKNFFTGAAYAYQLAAGPSIPLVRVNTASIQRSQTGNVTVDLVAVGGANPENSISFSLSYDPEHLVFISGALGAGAVGATLTVDSSLSTSGQVGFQVAKAAGTGFTTGTHQIVVVTFLALSNVLVPSTPIDITNFPTTEVLLAADGQPLTTIWQGGTVTITTGCVFTVSPTFRNLSAKTGSSTFNISTDVTCNWNAIEMIPWVTATSATSGTGSGSVSFDVDVNAGIARSGVAYIAGYPVAIRQGANFLDVAQDDVFYDFIGKLSAAGITAGCNANGPLYCPLNAVTRGQMAVFIIRALGNFTPATPATQRFGDVPPSDIFYNFVEDMAVRGITSGCGGGNYCPSSNVTREQMAAFIIRAVGVFSPPPPASQRFNDVLPSSVFYGFVEEMAVRGITAGCSVSPPLYCPSGNVTRGAMAVFLVRAFEL